MKILFVSHYSEIGGANNELLWLAKALKNKGHQIYVALPVHGSFEKRLNENHIEYGIFGYKRWIVTTKEKQKFISRNYKKIGITINNYIVSAKLCEYIKNNGIDVVHTNDSLDVVGCMAAKKTGVPHVWHLREFLEEDYERSIVYSEKYIQKWFSKSDYMVGISDVIISKYSSRFLRKNYVKIYDGLETNYLTRKDINGLKSPITMCFLGGCSVGKGFDLLLKIAKALKEKSSIDFKILVAGNCTEMETYRDLIEENRLKDNLVFLGFVEDVHTVYQNSDIFLMLSKLEAFGLVTVEAMLNKAVVVGIRCGGTKEIIVDKETGFLFDKDDIQGACSIITNIWNGKYNIDDISKKAYASAIDRFSIDRTAKEVEKIYLQLVSHKDNYRGGEK